MTFTRGEVLQLLTVLGQGMGVDLLRRARQLEPRLRVDTRTEPEELHDEAAERVAGFERRLEAVKRSPSGTMQAVRVDADTDPAPGPIPTPKPSER